MQEWLCISVSLLQWHQRHARPGIGLSLGRNLTTALANDTSVTGLGNGKEMEGTRNGRCTNGELLVVTNGKGKEKQEQVGIGTEGQADSE